jgi:uncharacterized protein
MKKILLLIVVIFLGACQQSPQKNYYLLTPLTPLAEKKPDSINRLLGLGPIELADYLKRPNMVRMYPDNRLNLNSNDFWAEPLDKGIVRVLSLNLANLDPARMMQPFPWRSDRIPDYSLRITFHELVLSHKQTKINATWELVNTADKNMIERQNFIRIVDTDNNGQAMAQSYSELLAELAEEMHKALLKVSQ